MFLAPCDVVYLHIHVRDGQTFFQVGGLEYLKWGDRRDSSLIKSLFFWKKSVCVCVCVCVWQGGGRLKPPPAPLPGSTIPACGNLIVKQVNSVDHAVQSFSQCNFDR